MGKLYINGEQEYGLYYMKLGELFEYTDKVAGIGYVHLVRTEFTAEETLLCRAEAKIYTGDLQGAYEDLNVWEASHRNIPGTTDGLEDFTRAVIILRRSRFGSMIPAHTYLTICTSTIYVTASIS